jgi:hypothetical protein
VGRRHLGAKMPNLMVVSQPNFPEGADPQKILQAVYQSYRFRMKFELPLEAEENYHVISVQVGDEIDAVTQADYYNSPLDPVRWKVKEKDVKLTGFKLANQKLIFIFT